MKVMRPKELPTPKPAKLENSDEDEPIKCWEPRFESSVQDPEDDDIEMANASAPTSVKPKPPVLAEPVKVPLP